MMTRISLMAKEKTLMTVIKDVSIIQSAWQ